MFFITYCFLDKLIYPFVLLSNLTHTEIYQSYSIKPCFVADRKKRLCLSNSQLLGASSFEYTIVIPVPRRESKQIIVIT